MSRTKKAPQPHPRRLNLRKATIGQVREWVHLSRDRPGHRQRVEGLLKQAPAHTRWDHLPWRLLDAFYGFEERFVVLDHIRLLTPCESTLARCSVVRSSHRVTAHLLGLNYYNVDGKKFFVRAGGEA